MKRTLIAIVLVVCFAGLTGLGALAMNRGNHQGLPFKGCLASAVQNAPCPADNSFNFSLFHLDALKKFSTAYLPSLLALISLLAFAVGALIKFRDKSAELVSAAPVLINNFLTLGSAYKTKSEFFGWLALQEKSPAIF